jgi:hypothetical protein
LREVLFGRVAAGEFQVPEAGLHLLGAGLKSPGLYFASAPAVSKSPFSGAATRFRHQDQREEQSEQRDSESGFVLIS